MAAPTDPFAPTQGYWDDDLERQFQEAMAQQPAAAPMPAPAPAPMPTPAPTAPEDEQLRQWHDYRQAQYEREGRSPAEQAEAHAYFDPKDREFLSQAKQRPAYPAGARTDAARIAQATSPVGTIGQIGKPTPLDEVPVGAIDFPPPHWAEHDALPPPPDAQPFQADAISGVDQRPPDDAFTSTSPIPTERPDEELSPEDLGARYADLEIEDREKFRSKIDGARANFAAKRMLDESTKTLADAEAHARDYETSVKQSMQKAADADAEAKAIADHDPIGDISIGRKIAGVIASFIGGFGMNKSGRNVGLEAVDGMINQAVEQQKLKLGEVGSRRNAIGEQLARSKDLLHAQETVRLAAWDGVIKTMESEVQQFDPRGTTALRTMDRITQAKAKYAALLAKYQTDQQKAIAAALKEERERAQLLETQRHNFAGEKNDATRAYADLTRAKAEKTKAAAESQVFTPEDFARLYPDVDPKLLPKVRMTDKQFQAQLESKGKAQTISNQSLAITNSVPGITIKDKDGKDAPFVALGRPEDVEKFRKRTAKLDELVSLIDDARRTRTGWTSDVGSSAERQELSTIWGKAQVAAKDYFELGAITKQDEPLIKGVLGTSDPSQLRNPLPGMEKARSLLIKDFKRDLINHGFPRDQQWDIPDLQKDAPTVTAEQFDLKTVLGTQYGKKVGEHDPDSLKFQTYTMSDEQKRLIDQWEKDASSSDEQTRVRAAQFLGQAADKAAIGSVKSYAKEAFGRITNISNIPVTEDIGDAPEVK